MHTDPALQKYFAAPAYLPEAMLVPQYVEETDSFCVGAPSPFLCLRPVIFRWRNMYSTIPRELLQKAGAPD